MMLSNPTKKQIEDAIGEIPNAPEKNRASIFLPQQKFNNTVDKIYKAKTSSERANILENSLEYKKPSVLFDQNRGEPLDENNGKIELEDKH